MSPHAVSGADKPPLWKSRQAWFCVLALVTGQSILYGCLRAGARSSPDFAGWLKTPPSSAFTVVLQGGLWLLAALWFSRARSIQAFMKPAGLHQGASLFGWGWAWVALGIAFINGYGVSKGWSASSRQPHPIGYDALGAGWWFFALKTTLVVPLYEEVVTRGFLYRAFRGSSGVLLSVLLIVLFSACFHWSSVSRSLFTFVSLGLLWALLCIVRETTGSLWNCILCHAVYNAAGIHLWLPAVIALLLLLPLLAGPVASIWWPKKTGVGYERAEPGAAPNGDPATLSGNSGVSEGPPSVS
jgi:membrane protease YdiL (CAAX protease family)